MINTKFLALLTSFQNLLRKFENSDFFKSEDYPLKIINYYLSSSNSVNSRAQESSPTSRSPSSRQCRFEQQRRRRAAEANSKPRSRCSPAAYESTLDRLCRTNAAIAEHARRFRQNLVSISYSFQSCWSHHWQRRSYYPSSPRRGKMTIPEPYFQPHPAFYRIRLSKHCFLTLNSVSSNHQYSRSTSSRARFENLRQ